MNMILEDAKEHKKPVWILLQDLSKAYDRVDLSILRKAMERIKLPVPCIDFILNFFTHRKNAILIKGGISDYYEVKIGIDQGEVISPLLWCIYFDPLLCEINTLNKGYTLTHKWMTDVSKGTQQQLQEQIAALGFMDDANWISGSLEDLESILDVADDFYLLTRAAINKDKSKLLTNTTTEPDPIPIRFGNTVTTIRPSFGGVRFLGVTINIHINHAIVKKELKMHIKRFIKITKTKHITDRQFCYIANHVLYPQLLYKMRNTPLSQAACLSLNQNVRSLYKHKCSFPKTAPNAVFHAKLFYNLNDIWTEQIAEISTSLLNQFNTSYTLLFQVSKIRLFRLQQQELAPTSPLVCWSPIHEFQHYRFNNIAAQLFLVQQADHRITFRSNSLLTNQISEGINALRDVLPPLYLKRYRAILHKYNLIYQEQITSANGLSLCTWSQFIKRPFTRHISTQRAPQFYLALRSLLLDE